VDRDAADVVANHFAFAAMHATAHFQSKRPHRIDDRLGTTHGARWAVERGKEAIALSGNFATTPALIAHPRGAPAERIDAAGTVYFSAWACS
jgi:hypothetical protein